SEVIALLHAARRASADPTRAASEPPEPPLAQSITSQRHPERRGPASTTVDSTIFARLTVEEETVFDHELNLRDLAMDVRSDAVGTGVAGTDSDESTGTSSDHELNQRELAAELQKEARPTKAPEPPGAAAQPVKRTAAP